MYSERCADGPGAYWNSAGMMSSPSGVVALAGGVYVAAGAEGKLRRMAWSA